MKCLTVSKEEGEMEAVMGHVHALRNIFEGAKRPVRKSSLCQRNDANHYFLSKDLSNLGVSS